MPYMTVAPRTERGENLLQNGILHFGAITK